MGAVGRSPRTAGTRRSPSTAGILSTAGTFGIGRPPVGAPEATRAAMRSSVVMAHLRRIDDSDFKGLPALSQLRRSPIAARPPTPRMPMPAAPVVVRRCLGRRSRWFRRDVVDGLPARVRVRVRRAADQGGNCEWVVRHWDVASA